MGKAKRVAIHCFLTTHYSHPHNFFWYRCLLFIVGVVYLLALPKRDLSHKAFFDENALLAGVVRREFSDPTSIARYAEDFKNLEEDKCVQISLI